MMWSDIVKKTSELPVTKFVSQKTEILKETKKVYRKKYRCRKCNLVVDGDLQEHMDKIHSKENYHYIVCKKCYHYILIETDMDDAEALKKHNSEKHFFKLVDTDKNNNNSTNIPRNEKDKQIDLLFKEVSVLPLYCKKKIE